MKFRKGDTTSERRAWARSYQEREARYEHPASTVEVRQQTDEEKQKLAEMRANKARRYQQSTFQVDIDAPVPKWVR